MRGVKVGSLARTSCSDLARARAHLLAPRLQHSRPMPVPLNDLAEHLETPQCHCMNASSVHTLRNCLDADSREKADLYLESDCDEELLIQLKFMSAVKVSAIRIEGKDKDIQLGVHSIMPVPPGPTPNPSKKAYGFTPSGPPAECDYPQNPAPNRQRCTTYK